MASGMLQLTERICIIVSQVQNMTYNDTHCLQCSLINLASAKYKDTSLQKDFK